MQLLSLSSMVSSNITIFDFRRPRSSVPPSKFSVKAQTDKGAICQLFKCQVLSALSFMFRHYCFMFASPSDIVYRHIHEGLYTYITTVTMSYTALLWYAHRPIEINSSLWPEHKAGTECCEKIGTLCIPRVLSLIVWHV